MKTEILCEGLSCGQDMSCGHLYVNVKVCVSHKLCFHGSDKSTA